MINQDPPPLQWPDDEGISHLSNPDKAPPSRPLLTDHSPVISGITRCSRQLFARAREDSGWCPWQPSRKSRSSPGNPDEGGYVILALRPARNRVGHGPALMLLASAKAAPGSQVTLDVNDLRHSAVAG